ILVRVLRALRERLPFKKIRTRQDPEAEMTRLHDAADEANLGPGAAESDLLVRAVRPLGGAQRRRGIGVTRLVRADERRRGHALSGANARIAAPGAGATRTSSPAAASSAEPCAISSGP